MNGRLAHFIQHLRESGQAWRARYAVVGIQTWRRTFRGHLKRSWDSVAAWQSQMPLHTRVPLPKLLMEAMAMTLVRLGCRRERRSELAWTAAVLVRVGFWGLMRPSECLNLLAGDFCFPAPGAGDPLVVAIVNPKNRAHMGRAQFGLISDKGTVTWARWLVSGLPPNVKLWGPRPLSFDGCGAGR